MEKEINNNCSLCKRYWNGCYGIKENICDRFKPLFEDMKKDQVIDVENIKEEEEKELLKLEADKNEVYDIDSKYLYQYLNELKRCIKNMKKNDNIKKNINNIRLNEKIKGSFLKDENLCIDCLHNNVCRYKEKYDKFISMLEPEDMFINLKCKYYLKRGINFY